MFALHGVQQAVIVAKHRVIVIAKKHVVQTEKIQKARTMIAKAFIFHSLNKSVTAAFTNEYNPKAIVTNKTGNGIIVNQNKKLAIPTVRMRTISQRNWREKNAWE